jgi:hypothetical protein
MCSEPAMRALQRLGLAELFARGHQAGHFGFGDGDFLAAEIGELDVCNNVVVRHGGILRGLARAV